MGKASFDLMDVTDSAGLGMRSWSLLLNWCFVAVSPGEFIVLSGLFCCFGAHLEAHGILHFRVTVRMCAWQSDMFKDTN